MAFAPWALRLKKGLKDWKRSKIVEELRSYGVKELRS